MPRDKVIISFTPDKKAKEIAREQLVRKATTAERIVRALAGFKNA